MRKLLFFIITLNVNLIVTAQSHRFADTTAQWYMGRTDNPLWCNGCYSYSTEHFTITGDTIVNSRTYQKLGTISTPVLLRDSAQRVYRYYEGRELVIYDFNYAAGDTFSLENLFGNASMNVFCHIDSVDTVHLLYPRKRMYLTYNNQSFFQDVWIEGIGSLHSNFLSPGLEQMGFDMPTYHTRCFYEQDSLLVHTDSVNLACQFDTFAPPSFYFADATAQWNVLDVQFCFGPCYSYSTVVSSTLNDTIIDGKKYQTISTYNVQSNCTFTEIYLRRDLMKIYGRTRLSNTEYQLYNFGLNAGDTITLYNVFGSWPYSSTFCKVDSVDSVIVGYSRKRLYVTYDMGGRDVWIEGIGATRTHFLSPGIDPFALDGPRQFLLCFFEKDSQLFHQKIITEDTINCVLNGTWIGINDIEEISASIFPNPSPSSFTITLSQQPQPNTALLIYNAVGALVKQEELTASTQQIDAAELPDGMYTYAILNNGIRQASGKLIVSH